MCLHIIIIPQLFICMLKIEIFDKILYSRENQQLSYFFINLK